MASMIKLLALTLFLGLIFQANGQPCFLSNIIVKQSKTGNLAHGMPEWKVTISNNCVCSQTDVKLNCSGFKTNEAVDPSILRVSGDECLLINGNSVGNVSFSYAWNPQFPFTPVSSQISCS